MKRLLPVADEPTTEKLKVQTTDDLLDNVEKFLRELPVICSVTTMALVMRGQMDAARTQLLINGRAKPEIIPEIERAAEFLQTLCENVRDKLEGEARERAQRPTYQQLIQHRIEESKNEIAHGDT